MDGTIVWSVWDVQYDENAFEISMQLCHNGTNLKAVRKNISETGEVRGFLEAKELQLHCGILLEDFTLQIKDYTIL